MHYDKIQLLDNLREKLETVHENKAKAYKSTRQAALDAPGRNESRYDSTKVETGWLADGIARGIQDLEDGLLALRQFNFNDTGNIVSVGDIIRLCDTKERTLTDLFILPYGAGEILQTDEGEVTVITPQTPLAQIALEELVGSFVVLQNTEDREYIILEKQ
jgi:hypothetical protein